MRRHHFVLLHSALWRIFGTCQTKNSRPALDPDQSLSQCAMDVPSTKDKEAGGVTLTTHLHLVPRLRMSGVIPLLLTPHGPPKTRTGTTLPVLQGNKLRAKCRIVHLSKWRSFSQARHSTNFYKLECSLPCSKQPSNKCSPFSPQLFLASYGRERKQTNEYLISCLRRGTKMSSPRSDVTQPTFRDNLSLQAVQE